MADDDIDFSRTCPTCASPNVSINQRGDYVCKDCGNISPPGGVASGLAPKAKVKEQPMKKAKKQAKQKPAKKQPKKPVSKPAPKPKKKFSLFGMFKGKKKKR